jgi:DNA modification methylase
MPIGEIIPYSKNPRVNNNAVDKTIMSIKEYGWQQPIVVDKNKIVIAGHTRLKAAIKMGLESCPVLIAENLTPAQAKAYRIADNRTGELATWDFELLACEAKDLIDMNFDVELTGFNLSDLGLDVKPGLTDEDEVPEVPEDPITKLGDLWILGEHRLLCGDSTDIKQVEKLMDGEKADMVFTDPPYGVDYKGIKNDSRKGLEELLDSAFYNYLKISKSGSSIYVFHSDRCADIFHKCFRKYFHFSSMIIWNKNSLTLSQTDYQSKHEPCMYGWMDNGNHRFMGDRKQVSVWDIYKESVKGHTTPKPIELIQKGLINSSKSDDLITDLFLGSGSTLIACEKTSRKCFGMELDPHYCDVIVKRWEDYTGKKAVLKEK